MLMKGGLCLRKKSYYIKIIFIIGLLSSFLFCFLINNFGKKSYMVKNGALWGVNITPSHKMLWRNVKTILPDEYETFIKKFSITTDGVDGTLASVAVIDSENTSFEFSVDFKDAISTDGTMTTNPEFLYTLIHEYMHIVSLEQTQMQPKGEHKGSTLVLQEGTTTEESYANLFYKRFWSHLHEEVKELEKNYDDTKYVDQISYDIFNSSPDSFINQYCATHPIEDLAETFAYFVLNEKPLGDSIKYEKVRFFYEFSQLKSLRSQFRKNIDIFKKTTNIST